MPSSARTLSPPPSSTLFPYTTLFRSNHDIGGHAIESGGNIALGGGTSLQKKYGIEDSPDRMFEDLVSWHDYRFSDREIVRAFCDWSADRKSTRLNSSHMSISYAVFCPNAQPTAIFYTLSLHDALPI